MDLEDSSMKSETSSGLSLGSIHVSCPVTTYRRDDRSSAKHSSSAPSLRTRFPVFRSCKIVLMAEEFEDQMAMADWFSCINMFPGEVIERTPEESVSGLFLLATQTTLFCGTFLNHIPM